MRDKDMHDDLTNLLPLARRKMLSREYALRLCVVALIYVTVLTGIAMALLLPTYILLTENENAKVVQLASIDATLSSSDETALSAHLADLNSNANTLSALAEASSTSAVMRSVFALAHPGITLSNFVYSPSNGTNAGTVAITGSATTRDALRSYQVEVSGAPFVQSADLPVSAYAQDTNIAFTITVTLSP